MEEDIVVNVDFEGGYQVSNSIQVVPVNIAWEDFELMLKVYADQEYIQVYYTDEEGENIKVNSQEELEQAFKVARLCNNTLHLQVHCTNCPPVEIVFQQPSPIIIEPREGEKEEKVIADLKKQSVLMTTIKNSSTNTSETEMDKIDKSNKYSVPIVMETGETNDPACDFTVAMETGEKQMIQHDVKIRDASKKNIKDKKPDDNTIDNNQKKLFFLKHKSSNLVLDVQHFSTLPETPVILWPKKNRIKEHVGNQLWYLDRKTGTVRSKFTDFCLDSSESGTKVSRYVEGKSSQMWVVGEGRISHKFNPNWVLGVKEVRPKPGATVVACENNQKDERLRFSIEYRGPGLTGVQKIKRNEYCAMKLKNKEGRKDCYSKLAAQVGHLKDNGELMNYDTRVKRSFQICDTGELDGELVTCGRRAPEVPPRLGVQGKPPKWFLDYMEKFKKEMIGSTSEAVASQTVNHVMKGLEGAVIASVNGSPGSISPPQRPQPASGTERQVYHHYGIICDGCESQIVGVRYKCGNCQDYDLCERCEAVEGVHQPDHVFLRIHRPVMTAGKKRDGTLVPLLKFNLYQHEENMIKQLQKEQVQAVKKEEKLQQRIPHPQPRIHKDSVEKLKKKQEKLKKKGEKIEEKLKKKEKRRLNEEKELPQKKEKLELPQFKVPDRMDAELISDETIPDGTHVQPGTKLVKRWLMKNMGTSPWVSGTKLDMIWGNMTPVEEEVNVPFTEVGKECPVTVVLEAPIEPGTYQSHWRMSYCGLRFGHRVWCSIVVDPREMLEHSDSRSSTVDLDLNVLTLKDNEEAQHDGAVGGEKEENKTEKDQESGEKKPSAPDAENDPQIEVVVGKPVENILLPIQGDRYFQLDADQLDLQKIEENIKDSVKNAPKVSQTATPNNTPFESRDVTPPKSPEPVDLESERIWTLSNSSSVEVVSEIGSEPSHLSEELVQERMANMGVKLDVDIDLESISSFDDDDSSGSDTDSDFFIVPIPDCFNPNLPASKVASTSLYVKKDEMQKQTVDDLLSASQKLESQPLLAPSLEYDENVNNKTETQEVEAQPLLTPSSSFAYTPLEQGNQEDEMFKSAIQNEENEAIEMQSLTPSELDLTNQSDTKEGEQKNEDDDNQQTAAKTIDKQEESDDEFVETIEPARAEGITQEQQGSADIASVIVNQAIDYATKASTKGYKICKDVFHTLQARNQYVPTQSNWTPKENTFTPPTQQWTPSTDDKEEVVNPPTLPPKDPTSPMNQLIEMGFADRRKNETLLKKHNNDVSKVIQEILSEDGNNWHSNRH